MLACSAMTLAGFVVGPLALDPPDVDGVARVAWAAILILLHKSCALTCG